jgi:hypothetical protein
MDATLNKFAYRCLPLTMGSQYGWELLCPSTFEACWHGGDATRAITIVRIGSGNGVLPESHFGGGVLTFHPCHLFRTEAPYQLFVSGPANVRKDGIAAMTAVVETDWLPFTFTMNWMFTRPGVTVRFEEGEPFCQFFPIHGDLLEQVEPEVRGIESDPELMTQYREWTESRDSFNEELKVPGSEADKKKWQQFYHHGTLHTGEPAATHHRTRLNLRRFVEVAPPKAAHVGAIGEDSAGRASSRPQVAALGVESVLMAHPATIVEDAEEQSVVLQNPDSGRRLRISRPLYELFSQLSGPRALGEILPAEPSRQERTLGYLGLLMEKGFLIPPELEHTLSGVEASDPPLPAPVASTVTTCPFAGHSPGQPGTVGELRVG